MSSSAAASDYVPRLLSLVFVLYAVVYGGLALVGNVAPTDTAVGATLVTLAGVGILLLYRLVLGVEQIAARP